MDEPLASLDAARKAEIMPFLLRLDAALHLPILYVTHALEEIGRLADHIVLLRAGRALAAGPLAEIAVRADLPLAQRDDAAAVLDATVLAQDAARRLSRLSAGGAEFWVPMLDAAPGAATRIRIPAREVILAGAAPEAISVHNVLPGTVRAIVADAPRHAALVEVGLPAGALLARVTADAIDRLRLTPGAPVLALVKSVAIEVLGRAGPASP
ncbi:MAG: TOBE domain-containing protein [Paludibaculum sp.]